MDKYVSALERVRRALQARLEDPYNWQGPGRRQFRSFGIPASKYAVVVTTDETSGPFLDEVRALGWRVVDHEALRTEETYGGWWPTSESVRFCASSGADARQQCSMVRSSRGE